MAKLLVVGGAGYVGGTASAWLTDQGHDVWILDDLSTGHREFTRLARGFTHARAGDRTVVRELLARERFDGVMHFAAKSLVEESVRNPAAYLENNVAQTEALIEEMLKAGVRRLVFSSTCAVYGEVGSGKIKENHPKMPINPYGESKLQAEQLIERMARERGLQAIVFRYFNAAGAEARLRVGERHENETHLIPRVLGALQRGEKVQVFGGDYPTKDGTCVRDYIHVWDLAAAHSLAMSQLLSFHDTRGSFKDYNLGTGVGHTVLEVVTACARALGKEAQISMEPRRAGDPSELVADTTRMERDFGFRTRQSLEDIAVSALNWEKKGAGLLKRAVFLDRDGTLNDDPGYLSDPKLMNLFPHVGEALQLLQSEGFELVVVSNQSGVARGLIEEKTLPLIHERLDELLGEAGSHIDHYELCLHHPNMNCYCRKPKPKLLFLAAQKRGLDISRSFMIGDKTSDIEAGRAAGCRGVALVRTGYGVESEAQLKSGDVDFVGDSLIDVAHWILKQSL